MIGEYELRVYAPTGWTHIVVNCGGRGAEEGFSIYYDGVYVNETQERRWWSPYLDDSLRIGQSRFRIPAWWDYDTYGRFVYADFRLYGTQDIDELLVFNRSLSQNDITLLAGKSAIHKATGSLQCYSQSHRLLTVLFTKPSAPYSGIHKAISSLQCYSQSHWLLAALFTKLAAPYSTIHKAAGSLQHYSQSHWLLATLFTKLPAP